MTERGYREVDITEFDAPAAGYRLVDVRDPDEYCGELGHLPGAELVPLSSLPTRARRWDRDEPIAVVCRSGNRSGRAAAALIALGFSDVVNLAGGMLAARARKAA